MLSTSCQSISQCRCITALSSAFDCLRKAAYPHVQNLADADPLHLRRFGCGSAPLLDRLQWAVSAVSQH